MRIGGLFDLLNEAEERGHRRPPSCFLNESCSARRGGFGRCVGKGEGYVCWYFRRLSELRMIEEWGICRRSSVCWMSPRYSRVQNREECVRILHQEVRDVSNQALQCYLRIPCTLHRTSADNVRTPSWSSTSGETSPLLSLDQHSAREKYYLTHACCASCPFH